MLARPFGRVPGTHRVYNLTVEGEHVYRVASLGALVHNNDCTVRVGHYTNRKGSRGIENDGRILAGDQNKVFAENARGRPLSPRDAETKYGIGRGRGRDYQEFDVPSDRVKRVWNETMNAWEFPIEGDVLLENANFVRRR